MIVLSASHENQRFVIEHDPSAGWYLLVYRESRCTHDFLQDSVARALAHALEDFGVPESAWVSPGAEARAAGEAPNWYTAVLVLECRIGGQPQPRPELQFRLIRAGSPEEAYALATEVGSATGHSYSNESGEEVAWQFLGLSDLIEVMDGAPRHGAEVYSLRSEQPVAQLFRPREELTVFWLEANKSKTARQILDRK